MGYYVCPNCNEKEYLLEFPPPEHRIIHNRLTQDLQEAKNTLWKFEVAYEENPTEAMNEYYRGRRRAQNRRSVNTTHVTRIE